ncbi:MAG: multifunctional CCA tRNA nucleotidyl transferase/2'3'-cyclic phosphodiesterase/2'nucleotidase/phosphatase [Wenzhouxiangella sp.]
MQVYQVGGSVRDRLLGLPAGDRDFVVVGAGPEELVRRGFRPVGQDFPVFLHPVTGEEYALARTERKQGHGYRGFVFRTGPEVSLEQDLARRDLTINAMALDPDGCLIDPFHGRLDLQAGRLRHISDAFREDPVRILRLARFATRFAAFEIAPRTLELCRDMVKSGEVEHLVPERVWQEMSRALLHDAPSRFVEVLRETGALALILPEVAAVLERPDQGWGTLLALDQAAQLGADLAVRFALLVRDTGDGGSIEALSRRLRVPTDCREMAELVGTLCAKAHSVEQMEPEEVLQVLERLDVFRRPQRLSRFLLACEAADRASRAGPRRPYRQAELWRKAAVAARSVDGGALARQGLQGGKIAAALRQQRLARIADLALDQDLKNC